MVKSKPPAPELATMAPLLGRLSMERPWQPIALMVLAPLSAGLALAKPATINRGQPIDRSLPMDRSRSFDGPGPNPLIV